MQSYHCRAGRHGDRCGWRRNHEHGVCCFRRVLPAHRSDRDGIRRGRRCWRRIGAVAGDDAHRLIAAGHTVNQPVHCRVRGVLDRRGEGDIAIRLNAGAARRNADTHRGRWVCERAAGAIATGRILESGSDATAATTRGNQREYRHGKHQILGTARLNQRTNRHRSYLRKRPGAEKENALLTKP